MIAPNTDLILLKCPIELDQANQLTFSNATAQYNYFNGLPKLVEDGFTYQRKDGKIRFPACADNLYSYNYCMYRNSSYSNKWFYAFITNIEYLNDNTSLISIKTDVWQTWQFDITWYRSYVEREHTNDDTIGANILNEDTSEGEYVCNGGTEVPIADVQNYLIAIQCSDAPNNLKAFLLSEPRVYGGLRSGAWTFMVEATTSGANANFDNLIKWFDYSKKTEAIIAMYVMPRTFLPSGTAATNVRDDIDPTYGAYVYKLPSSVGPTLSDSREVTINTTIDGYIPHNNRLFCFPYNYIKLSNHAGSDAVLKWEEFQTTGHKAVFYTHVIPNQGVDSRIIPKYYKYNSENIHAYYDYGLTGAKMPMISWQSDYYLNWQATNGINIANHTRSYVYETQNTGLASNIPDSAEGISSGSRTTTLGALLGGSQNMLSFLSGAGQFIKSIASDVSGAGFNAYMTPDTIEGCANVGDLNFAEKCTTFSIQKMSIKRQMAIVIDQYFDMYGYKTLKNKVPNITGRANWNFVKTKGCNIVGDILQSDMQEIKNMFDTGVTLWHNPATFRDYSQSNNIV